LQLAGVGDSSNSVSARSTHAQSIFAQFQAQALLAGKLSANRGGSDATGELAYSETFYPFSSFGWSPLHAIESERFHYIDAPKPELYDLEADPGETRNIAGEQPAAVAVFRKKPEALNKGLADPKDKLWEFNAILKAGDAFQHREDDQAETLLTEVQQKDPQIYVIPFMLGEAALRRQNWQRAAEQLQRCLELNPNFDNAMTGTALALTKLGRADEAKSWLTKAVQSNPQNYRAWYQIGLLDAGSDRVAALGAYQKVIAIQPNFSPGQRETGMALFQQKDYAGAAIHLEKALALGLEDARLHNFLGICYSQTARVLKAVHEHQRAIELDPELAEAHLNLGLDYQRTGKASQAQTEYKTACKLEAKFCGVTAR
jgi:tetratricopeptide (TPR) repeat protein